MDGRSMVTKNGLPFPAHAGEYGTGSGAEPDGAVFLPSAEGTSRNMRQLFLYVRARSSMRMTM